MPGTLELTEQQLVNYSIHCLNARGHYVWRNNSGVSHASYTNKQGQTSNRIWRAGIKGGSDILGICKCGKFIAIECKVGKNKPTPAQIQFLNEIENRHGHAQCIWTSQEIEDFENSWNCKGGDIIW